MAIVIWARVESEIFVFSQSGWAIVTRHRNGERRFIVVPVWMGRRFCVVVDGCGSFPVITSG